MRLEGARARGAIVVALSCGATFLLLRIALARIWVSGAWHDPPPVNVIALGTLGAVGIVSGALLLARPRARLWMLCVAWATVVVTLSVALAALGHNSADLIALLATVAGITGLPWARGAARMRPPGQH